MKRIFSILLGASIIIASLWIGSYFLVTLPDKHWAMFPTAMTAFLAALAGAAVIIFGAIE